MEYVHVRSLEKYHPGYKDRTLQWGKIFINMADGDPETELIENEIDWARLIKIILLELRAQGPLPNSDAYWARKGFDIKKRPMSKTLQVLHNFIEVVTEPLRREDKEEDKSREDKEEDVDDFSHPFFKDPVFKETFESYLGSRKKKATKHAKELILKDLSKYDLNTAIKMIEQSIKNGWIGIFPLKNEEGRILTQAQKIGVQSMARLEERLKNE